MKPIILPDGRVNYGVFDEPLNFNFHDFVVRDFFGKPVGAIKKKFTFHAFNYIGIVTPEWLIGIAAVDLGYLHTVFAYLYRFGKGMEFSFDTKGPGSGRLVLPPNPDKYSISFDAKKSRLSINKSHAEKLLETDADFKGRLKVRAKANYSMESHNPLRVLNPSEPFRFTFTEKCSPIACQELFVQLDGKDISPALEDAAILYDWSGGYMRRDTNWLWAAFSGKDATGKTPVGANFAALVNEAYFSENAFWVENSRTRVTRAIFDLNLFEPYRPWRIWDEAGTVDLSFTPEDERGEKVNAKILKTFFRQFFGTFEGSLTPPGQKPVELKNMRGLTEIHKALW